MVKVLGHVPVNHRQTSELLYFTGIYYTTWLYGFVPGVVKK